ncbi:MAG: hypothetical protein ABIP38_10925 [Steroidobacteraceae bacterium]
MLNQRPAAQRLLVQGVMASTTRLVRCLLEGRDGPEVRGLMLERRRMLTDLAAQLALPDEAAPMVALRAAIVESDRTLETLLA